MSARGEEGPGHSRKIKVKPASVKQEVNAKYNLCVDLDKFNGTEVCRRKRMCNDKKASSTCITDQCAYRLGRQHTLDLALSI